MNIDIEREYDKFIENFDFNEKLALMTDKSHLARWAYGACQEWIRDFTSSYMKWAVLDFDGFSTDQIDNRNTYRKAIREKINELPGIKQELKTKFNNNEILMEMLK